MSEIQWASHTVRVRKPDTVDLLLGAITENNVPRKARIRLITTPGDRPWEPGTNEIEFTWGSDQ